VRVTLLLEHLPERARHRLEVVVLSIGTVSIAYLAYWANKFTYESFMFNEVAQGLLPIPIWIPQASFAFGSLLLLVAVVDELVLVARGAKPSYVTAVEERHAKGDFSSDV
jgi:TRAP-type C4-dicarboxylate transport system permease small subunit